MHLFFGKKFRKISKIITIFVVIFSWAFSGYPPIDLGLDLSPKINTVKAADFQNGRAAFITAQDPHTYWELNSTNLGTNFGHDATASGGDNPNVVAGDISTSDSYEGMSNQNDPTISGDLDVMIVTDSAWLMYIPAGLTHSTHYGIWHNGGGTNAQGTGVRATATGVEIACTHNNAANVMDTVIVEIPDASLPNWFAVGCQLASYGGTQGDMALWINGVAEGSGTRVNTLDYGSGDPDFGNFSGTDPDQSDVIYPVSYSGGDWGGNTAITGSGILIANFTADNPTDNGSGDNSPGAGDDFYTDYYDAHSTLASPNTRQLHFRWRDDTTALNSDGGWLAVEDSNGISDASKETTHRLRFEVANAGVAVEDAARTYEIQYGVKGASCGAVSSWTGIADSTDAFEMVDSTNITSDGQATTALLANTEAYTFLAGEGRDTADTTGSIGPLTNDYYTEIEYSFQATDNAITGEDYCFRLYDTTADSALDIYSVYPEVTLSSTNLSYSKTIMEWGTEASVGDDAWTTVNFAGTYTDPIFVCSAEYNANIGNESDGTADSVVCRVQSVGATSAQVRLQEPGTLVGASGNLTDETIHWMVVEAGDYDTGDIKMEAFKYTSTVTDGKTPGWTGQSQTLTQSYTNPVVVGQVMTTNDTSHSQFWAHNGSNGLPTSASLYAGKNISEDSDTTRSNETVGVIVIEQANDTVNSVVYEARVQGQTIERIDDTHTNYTFNTAFGSTPAVGIISQGGVSGTDGPYPSLYGATPLSTTNIYPVIMETEIVDTEQSGNTEYVPYIVFESAGTYTANINVALDQDTYRFYENTNAIQPSTPLGNENTAITNVANASVLRVRTAIQTGDALESSVLQFKLQYGQGATCSAIGTWYDVGALDSGTIWRGYNNATPADGAAVTASLLNSQANVLESYEEANSSVANLVQIADGSRGEWDWVVENNGATGGTDYCFRITKSDGSVMEYTRYPKVTTATASISISLNTDGAVALGFLALDSIQDTSATGINDIEVVSVDNGPADLDVRSSVFTEGGNTWALGASNGVDQIRWDFASTTPITWTNFALADTLYSLQKSVPEGQTRDLMLRLQLPTATASFDQYSGAVTIVASTP
jgi:hypothetical protein